MLIVVFALIIVSDLPQGYVTIVANAKAPVYYKGNKDCGGVSLTFNVYENADIVNEMITLLKKRGAKATFYVGGCWADDNEATVKRIVEEGFEIGNHGYFHKDHKKLSLEDNLSEINACAKLVKAFTGVNMSLFAPPSGSYSGNCVEAAQKLGYKLVMWSKDTIDWRDNDVSLIVKRATNTLTSGDIILMHPKQHTLTALPEILDIIEQKKLKALTVTECLALNSLGV